MRLKSLSLNRYGPFDELTVDFDPRPGMLNLLMAPNGAGKSVLRSAIRDLLFGIHGQSPMGFRYGYPGMRLTALAVAPDGSTLSFGRRKGRGNTLIGGAGGPLDPGILPTLIGLADDQQFDRLFAMDSALLREGGRQLLESDGDLTQAMFAAAGGISNLREVLRGIEAERDAMASTRRAASRALYLALDEFDKASSDLRQSEVRPSDWKTLTAAVEMAKAKRVEIANAEAACRARIALVERIKRVRPSLARLDRAAETLAGLASAPRLPAELDDQWATAAADQTGLAAQLRDLEAEIVRREQEIGAVQADHAVLDAAERVEAVRRQYDETAADRRDLPRRTDDHDHLTEQLGELLASLGVAAGADGDPSLPDEILLAEAGGLVTAHAGVEQALNQALRAERRSAQELAEAQAQLGLLPEATDLRGLKALAAEATRAGNPSERLGGLTAGLERAESQVGTALARVGGWSAGLDALLACTVPQEEACRLAGTALQDDRDALADAGKAHRTATDAHDDLVRRLAEMRAGAPLPEPSVVQAARSRRDHGWSLIRRIKFDGDLDQSAPEVAAFAETAGLATSFERAVDAADGLADRRDAESQRLAELAELERQLKRAAAERDAAAAAVERQAERLAEAQARWTGLLAPLGLPGDTTAADLSAFLAARERVLAAVESRAEAAAALTAERHVQAELAQRLAAALGRKPGPLAALLAIAQERIDAEREQASARAGGISKVETLTSAVAECGRDLGEAKQAMAAWAGRWAGMLRRLGRPQDEAPAGTGKAIELFKAAREALKGRRELAHRIAGMRANIAACADAAGSLMAEVAPDLAALPLDRAVPELGIRLGQAAKAAEQLKAQSVELDRARGSRNDTQRKLEEVDRQLTELRSRIGAETDDEARERLRLAGELRAAEVARDNAMSRLLDAGDGLSCDELISLVRAHADLDPDHELSLLEGEAIARAVERDDAVRDEQKQERELEDRLRGSPAADADDRRQRAVAAIIRITEESCRLDLAAQLLRAGLERLRMDEDRGMAGRIGAVFARLTGGVYAGVEAEEDGAGRQLLLAVEADGEARKRIDELSEGTRDQLFLAMRLVMIEDYAARSPMPPFIADDLLQTSDDRRSTLALQELVELSRHAQVILLTHHRHVLDLARRLPAESLHVCSLPGHAP